MSQILIMYQLTIIFKGELQASHIDELAAK